MESFPMFLSLSPFPLSLFLFLALSLSLSCGAPAGPGPGAPDRTVQLSKPFGHLVGSTETVQLALGQLF